MKRPLLILLLLGGWVRTSSAAEPVPSHWAFQPVRHPEPPRVQRADWCRTEIDRFLLAAWERQGVPPSPEADRRTLIRRAAFDLTGLPPTAPETDAYLADGTPDAWDRVVDRLLASPHYGEHWGRHWLDVVRYADTAGETADYPVPVAWRYRDYVIQAFNSDKPYDVFLREQIAGDILAREGPREQYAERVTATGYLAISRRFGFDSENYHHLTIQDSIDNLGQAMLGLTLGCARCHAHKYDPVSMQDYYGLYGIFDSTRYAFPGSEQKQRHRALVPLVPPEEAQPRWRAFEARVATLVRKLERAKQAVPNAVLRSLDDLDGDFEMQAPAAGGSKGVLVAPWLYNGPIAVTQDAQSPFKNLYALGKVGASIPSGTNGYFLAQTLYPRRSRAAGGSLHLNLDFRFASNPPSGAAHRLRLGTATDTLCEVWLRADHAEFRSGGRQVPLRKLTPGLWYNLQLSVDLTGGTVSGRLGRPDDLTDFNAVPLPSDASDIMDFLALESVAADPGPLAAIVFDNLGVQDTPIPPVSTEPGSPSLASDGPSLPSLQSQVKELAGIDGDFELQSAGGAPAAPWHPGPNSAVIIRTDSQSPYRNLHPPGQRGIHLPNSEAYNGFGQTLPRRWEASQVSQLHIAFDFRCQDVAAGGEGSWRYYIGHGAGTSPAIELFFNQRQFFHRSGDSREALQTLQVGEWYQVQLVLNLPSRSYTGTLTSPSGSLAFQGSTASGWDGIIDYTFIDSYGHLGGVKPGLDADNFVLQEKPLNAFDAPPLDAAETTLAERRTKMAELRTRIARLEAEGVATRQELESLLASGPFDMAYAVSEGTPRDAALQIRGEPDRPGEIVPRGWLSVLGGQPVPKGFPGSGRLALANWLTDTNNPLTARVMVNRIWQYHFGQGLVRTPNDFGTRGQPPSNPDLLDYLAVRFMQSGWSIKAMHRWILSSAAYRQQSRFSAPLSESWAGNATDACPVVPSIGTASGASAQTARAAASTDAATDPFSPFPRRRLAAEEIRDAILRAGGGLDSSPATGHPFPAPTTWGYTQHGPYAGVYDHERRSVYLMTQRLKRHPFLALFDGADPNSSSPERRTSTVPTQALYFLNDPFVHAQATRLAEAVLASAREPEAIVIAAYRRALARNPTPMERDDGVAFLNLYRKELEAGGTTHATPLATAALARVLFGSNEFLTVD